MPNTTLSLISCINAPVQKNKALLSIKSLTNARLFSLGFPQKPCVAVAHNGEKFAPIKWFWNFALTFLHRLPLLINNTPFDAFCRTYVNNANAKHLKSSLISRGPPPCQGFLVSCFGKCTCLTDVLHSVCSY